jgi:hypothetical protein
VLAEQRREIVARKVALKSATTQAGEFLHEEIRKVRRVFASVSLMKCKRRQVFSVPFS